jgi:hypothetical protein
MYPLILLVGRAGSGKDTVAAMLTEYGGTVIAQADPLKRFAQQVFGFTTKQLWGASEYRNRPDKRGGRAFLDCWMRRDLEKEAWLQDLRNHCGDTGIDSGALDTWFYTHVAGEEKVTPRSVLQTLGTEMGRKHDSDVWVKYSHGVAKSLLESGTTYSQTRGTEAGSHRTGFVIISDGRFSNEILAVKRVGGVVINVANPEEEAVLSTVSSHASEAEQLSIPSHWFDFVVVNDKKRGLGPLQQKIHSVADYLLKQPEVLWRP